MTIFVFLGPSLPLSRARALIDAEFLPPVSMGDVYVLLETRARKGDVIAIVDGLFEQVGAVWHKEVLYALAAGVKVYGASSMGALRAAELHPFGMRGVGRIFEDYRLGILTDDDDVAVAHAQVEGDYRSLSVAMVSLRYALVAMRDTDVLSPRQCEALVTFAKSLPYAQRSWGALLEYAREQQMSSAVLDALRAESREPDAKALDAEQLLREIAAVSDQLGEPDAAGFCFNRTAFWAMLEYEMHTRVAASVANAGADRLMADAIRTHSPHRRQVEEEAAILEIAERRAAKWRPDQAAMRAAAANIAHRHRLLSKEALHAWRAEQGIDGPAWSALVALEARRDRLLSELRPSLAPYLAIAARRAGLAGQIAREVDALDSAGTERQLLKTSMNEDDVDVGDLQKWYVARCGPMLPDPESHALALGYSTLRDFVTAIARAYRASTPDRQKAV